MPKVSVNIPCYNSQDFIKETLISVLGQTYSDFEIIVMDDGSSDRTKDIVKSFNDSRIKYFYKENEGLSATRNKAVEASSGEFIAFLDHDDLWLPDKLEKQMPLFEKSDTVALVYSDSYLLLKEKKEKFTYFNRSNPKRGYVFEDLLLESTNFIPLSSVIVKKEAIAKIGNFKTDFKIGEEYELFLRMAENFEFDYINEPLSAYRVHERNFSQKKDLYVNEALEILEFWKKRNPLFFEKNKHKFQKKEANLFSELATYYALNFEKEKSIYNFDLGLKKEKKASIFIKRYILRFFGCGFYRIFDRVIKKLR